MQLERVYDLAFAILPDGGIELEQGFAEVNRISLHPCHVRMLMERAGHLVPPPPVDDLAKRLALQLCELRDGLADEFGRSPAIGRLYTQAVAACDMLPDAVYPQWLYADEAETPVAQGKSEAAIQPEFNLEPSPKEPV